MFYIEQGDKILQFEQTKEQLETLISFAPQYAGLEIKESPVDIVEFEGAFYFADDEEYLAKVAQKEAERIQELSMTRSDFFDGTITAWGIGQDELLVLIQGLLAMLPIENVKKLIAINNFKNALNFYRKHDLFKMLVDIPIQLTDTIQVVLTDECLDKFFDEVNKGNKATAWQYLPKPIMIPSEEEDETESNTTNEPTDISV